MLKGTSALAVRGQNEVRVLGSAQCAEPNASTYFGPQLYMTTQLVFFVQMTKKDRTRIISVNYGNSSIQYQKQ